MSAQNFSPNRPEHCPEPSFPPASHLNLLIWHMLAEQAVYV